MKNYPRSWKSRRGMVTLEYIMVITVCVIGVAGGLGALRNATLTELGDMSEAISSLNVLPGGNIPIAPLNAPGGSPDPQPDPGVTFYP